jgi:cysteinyl-tRNA synthetase
LWGVLREQNVSAADALGAAFDMDRVLGLGLAALERVEAAPVDAGLAAGIEALIAERAAAKKEKDFARADSIRNGLKARGIILEDGSGGTSWKIVPGGGSEGASAPEHSRNS